MVRRFKRWGVCPKTHHSEAMHVECVARARPDDSLRGRADATRIDVLGKSVAHRVVDFVVALALKTIAAAKRA